MLSVTPTILTASMVVKSRRGSQTACWARLSARTQEKIRHSITEHTGKGQRPGIAQRPIILYMCVQSEFSAKCCARWTFRAPFPTLWGRWPGLDPTHVISPKETPNHRNSSLCTPSTRRPRRVGGFRSALRRLLRRERRHNGLGVLLELVEDGKCRCFKGKMHQTHLSLDLSRQRVDCGQIATDRSNARVERPNLQGHGGGLAQHT